MTLPRPLRVLVIEDEALLAMELESLVEEAGHEVVGWAPSARQAIELSDSVDADLAFVDIQLQEGSSGIDVARHLRLKEPCMVVFLTATPKQLPDDLAGACGVISKPYTINSLLDCLAYLEQGIRRPPPELPRPYAFRLSPKYLQEWSAAL